MCGLRVHPRENSALRSCSNRRAPLSASPYELCPGPIASHNGWNRLAHVLLALRQRFCVPFLPNGILTAPGLLSNLGCRDESDSTSKPKISTSFPCWFATHPLLQCLLCIQRRMPPARSIFFSRYHLLLRQPPTRSVQANMMGAWERRKVRGRGGNRVGERERERGRAALESLPAEGVHEFSIGYSRKPLEIAPPPFPNGLFLLSWPRTLP